MGRVLELDVYQAVVLTTGLMVLVFATLYVLYLLVRNKNVRYTEVYLSAEGEDVVSNPMPGVGGLYWAFIRQYARRVYRLLLDRVQTGSLADWFYFISSWLGVLVLLSIILSLLYLAARW
ncbi:sodium:proton antiporter [Thermogladius sp. KZ2Tp1]|uniref:sodium:proton antiporter n=1 Tax=Thermogladius sp. KZ2Tp1 TaxID=3136289 RepID=UPI003DA8DD0D